MGILAQGNLLLENYHIYHIEDVDQSLAELPPELTKIGKYTLLTGIQSACKLLCRMHVCPS